MTTLAVEYDNNVGYNVSAYSGAAWRPVLTIPHYADYNDCSMVAATELVCYGRRRCYFTRERRAIYAFDGQTTTHITTLDTTCSEIAEIDGEICYAYYSHPISTLDRGRGTVYLSWAIADKLRNIIHSDGCEYVTSDKDGILHDELPIRLLDTEVDKDSRYRRQSSGVWLCGSVWTTCNTNAGPVLVSRDPRIAEIRQLHGTLYSVKGCSGGNLAMGSFETVEALYDPRADAMYDLDTHISARIIVEIP